MLVRLQFKCAKASVVFSSNFDNFVKFINFDDFDLEVYSSVPLLSSCTHIDIQSIFAKGIVKQIASLFCR